MSASSSSNIVSETKHQAQGDAEPQPQPQLLTLYSMKYCPFAQRTRLVLQHKQVKHRIVNVNLAKKPDWFLAKAPVGKVPVLEETDSKFVLEESLVTAEYLEEAYPESPLYPSDPKRRALIRMAVSRFSDCIPAYYRCLFARDDKEAGDKSWQQLMDALASLQPQLRGGNFFGGCDTVQMGDLMIWPWIERLPVLAKVIGQQVATEKLADLWRWRGRMESVAAVQQTRTTDEVHEAFYMSVVANSPQYDF